jgi:ubiquinone/menaquinone biosynthesis C-methylase UbiE
MDVNGRRLLHARLTERTVRPSLIATPIDFGESTSIERRANVRAALGPLFPLYVYLSKSVPYPAKNLSIAGTAIDGPPIGAVGEVVGDVQFEAPGLGSFTATVRIRSITPRRVRCNRIGLSFVKLPEAAAEVLERCIRAKEPSGNSRSSNSEHRAEVSWSKYAGAYDSMCDANPAYLNNLSLFRDWLRRSNIGHSPTICDVGAGTGNYVLETYRLRPSAQFIHVDNDSRMNALASEKYRAAKMPPVRFEARGIEKALLDDASIDLAICVNSLYALSDPTATVDRLYSLIKPGGQLFAIDLGRLMNVSSWTKYILSCSVQTRGVLSTARRLLLSREAVRQNSFIRRNQVVRRYWMHSNESFLEHLRRAGFLITETGSCYRGFCNFAVGVRPPELACK